MLYKSNLIIFYYYLTIENINLLFHRLLHIKFKFIIKKVSKNDKKKNCNSEFLTYIRVYIKKNLNMFYYLSNYICIVKNIRILFYRLFYIKFKFIIKKFYKNDPKNYNPKFLTYIRVYIKKI